MGVIEVKGLVKHFSQKGKRIKAVDGISFSIEKNKIYGFLGPNGAGKSTTIKVMMGLIYPTKGQVLIRNIDASKPEARKSVGFLPENPSFPEALTGWELIEFSAKMHGVSKDQARVRGREILEQLLLEDSADRPIRKYSKGMVQKIGFASVLVHKPDIIVLDEPMSGLDPVGRFIFKKILKDFKNEGGTIFFSSHIIPDVEDLCDKVIVINKGKILTVLDVEKIRTLSIRAYEIVFKTNKELDADFDIEDIGESMKKVKVDAPRVFKILDWLKNYDAELLSIQPISENLESIFIKLTQEGQ